jgi:folate-binding protein YgfZ
MDSTALQIRGAGLGAKLVGEYRGAITAAHFGDVRDEFAALRSGCGVYDLGFRARISLTGSDRVRWLNGMVTNNVRDLAVGHGVYSFLLNPQGHILGDLYAYNRGDSITIDTDRSQLERILATFDHFIIMDDVEVTDLSQQVTAVGVAGPKAREIVQAAGIRIPETEPLQMVEAKCTCNCDCISCTVVHSGEMPQGYEIWVGPEKVKELWDGLVAVGATPVGSEALDMLRIVSGIPRYGVDIRERDLPQETEQTRALNFNKGCYVGQEIVERIRSRGAVHRKFTGFISEDGAQIPVGAKISAGEKEVGEITSAVSLPFAGCEKTVALGYIRREVGIPGREVRIGTAQGMVVQLPFDEARLVREETRLDHQKV